MTYWNNEALCFDQFYRDMCKYSFEFDDHLVAQAEKTMKEGVNLHQWIQLQVEALLLHQIVNPAGLRTHVHGLTDSQLEQELKGYSQISESDFPDLPKSAYVHNLNSNKGKITKGLEKWL